MALTDGQLAQLAHASYRHALQLQHFLGAADFWDHDLHVPVATQLRVLLCDRELPILLTFAHEKRIPLRIWGPRRPGSCPNTQVLLSWTALAASWTPDAGGYEMSIEEYLDTGVAVIPVGQEGKAFSPRQIIKWVANKEGGAHFSFDKSATLEALRQTQWQSGDTVVASFQAKQVLQALGHWTHTAIGTCLGVVPIQGS
jgi:hypothetical protein